MNKHDLEFLPGTIVEICAYLEYKTIDYGKFAMVLSLDKQTSTHDRFVYTVIVDDRREVYNSLYFKRLDTDKK
jgi:hypothetical protein